jgi:hypothetical protein
MTGRLINSVFDIRASGFVGCSNALEKQCPVVGPMVNCVTIESCKTSASLDHFPCILPRRHLQARRASIRDGARPLLSLAAACSGDVFEQLQLECFCDGEC